ncbi:peptidoglycan-binding protein [Candidatus Gracilibacteria bacterium]|nr:peptidoglycan-binding protein [Candidatus Gracilibacteria bacterium]
MPKGLLPAPLYFLDARDGQIWLLAADGDSKRQITFERLPIRDFAAAGTTLVYVLEDTATKIVVLLGPGGRRELFSGPAAAPRIAPDASEVFYRVDEAVDGLIVGQDSAPTGIYRQGSNGGRPGLLHADEGDRHFSPLVLAPDGTRLLALAIDNNVQIRQLAVIGLGNPTQSTLLDQLLCCDASWSSDSAQIVIGSSAVSTAAGEIIYGGLWVIDAVNGVATTVIEPFVGSEAAPADAYLQFSAPYLFEDGSIAVFSAPGDYPLGSDLLQTLDRFTAGGERIVAGAEVFPLLSALWAPDGRGGVIVRYVPAGAAAPLEFQPLLWLSDDGARQVELDGSGSALAWRFASPDDNPDDCAAFAPLSFQPEAERRFDSNVADLQARLIARGYTQVGSIDGFFGEQTRAALQAFQNDHNLATSGSLDCASWQKLFL